MYSKLTETERKAETAVRDAAKKLHNLDPHDTGSQVFDIGHGPVTAMPGFGTDSAYLAKTNAKNYGGASVGDRYNAMVEAAKNSGATDEQIAAAVLNPDKMKDLPNGEARNVVAKLAFCGNVSEAQRVPDADRIFRAAMRSVRDGKTTLAQTLNGPDALFPAAVRAEDMRHALTDTTLGKKSDAQIHPALAGYQSDY